MVLRPEERAPIAALIDFMSRERGKAYHVHENPNDPPDVIADEVPGSRRIGVEHTQIVTQDREAIAAWRRFQEELDAVTPPAGTYMVGPADLDNRLPLVAGSPARVAAQVVDAIEAHPAWTPGTSIIVPGQPHIKVVMFAKTGAALIGLSALGHRPWPQVLQALQDRLDMKIESIGRWAPVDERVLLVDATSASTLVHPSLEENLYDDVWFLDKHGLLPFDGVYLVRGADIARIWPR